MCWIVQWTYVDVESVRCHLRNARNHLEMPGLKDWRRVLERPFYTSSVFTVIRPAWPPYGPHRCLFYIDLAVHYVSFQNFLPGCAVRFTDMEKALDRASLHCIGKMSLSVHVSLGSGLPGTFGNNFHQWCAVGVTLSVSDKWCTILLMFLSFHCHSNSAYDIASWCGSWTISCIWLLLHLFRPEFKKIKTNFKKIKSNFKKDEDQFQKP